MSTYLEILTVAFIAQLAVLPGEKVQFIIAGLSTRYNPIVVVTAAGSAFAGWTALEILFGQALQTVLPPVALNAVTASLFLLFAILLYRSAPSADTSTHVDADASETVTAETDGGLAAREMVSLPGPLDRVSGSFGGFLPIFILMVTGEFGDKTQLVTIGLAVQYGATSAIWIGEMLAIIPISLANAYVFHSFSGRVNMRTAYLGSALLFAFFGVDAIMSIAFDFSVWEMIIAEITTVVSAAI